jgi:serine/threonine protein kinase
MPNQDSIPTNDIPSLNDGKTPQSQGGAILLNEFEIERELGRGGMGKVYLVRSRTTGRKFALKEALVKDNTQQKAFLAELQTWIDLPEHPNILACRFFRTVGNETLIFADYCEGGSLADWIAEGKLQTLEEKLDVAIQFACGIHAIHERGLVHQDIKPGNVLMTKSGVPKVADFGLARAKQRMAATSQAKGAQSVADAAALVTSGGIHEFSCEADLMNLISTLANEPGT